MSNNQNAPKARKNGSTSNNQEVRRNNQSNILEGVSAPPALPEVNETVTDKILFVRSMGRIVVRVPSIWEPQHWEWFKNEVEKKFRENGLINDRDSDYSYTEVQEDDRNEIVIVNNSNAIIPMRYIANEIYKLAANDDKAVRIFRFVSAHVDFDDEEYVDKLNSGGLTGVLFLTDAMKGSSHRYVANQVPNGYRVKTSHFSTSLWRHDSRSLKYNIPFNKYVAIIVYDIKNYVNRVVNGEETSLPVFDITSIQFYDDSADPRRYGKIRSSGKRSDLISDYPFQAFEKSLGRGSKTILNRFGDNIDGDFSNIFNALYELTTLGTKADDSEFVKPVSVMETAFEESEVKKDVKVKKSRGKKKQHVVEEEEEIFEEAPEETPAEEVAPAETTSEDSGEIIE
jgi:hypothetical protein